MQAYVNGLGNEGEACDHGSSKYAFKHEWRAMVFQFGFVFFPSGTGMK